ncbi:hypothetical protein N7488_002918 [Penicillium malachiteum]|nr:hypothetical protein N7488_002918 [Penicillium malachiteum]
MRNLRLAWSTLLYEHTVHCPSLVRPLRDQLVHIATVHPLLRAAQLSPRKSGRSTERGVALVIVRILQGFQLAPPNKTGTASVRNLGLEDHTPSLIPLFARGDVCPG